MTYVAISYRCALCDKSNYADAETRLDGPDAEVVVFTVDSEKPCRGCGRPLADSLAALALNDSAPAPSKSREEGSDA